MRRLLLAGAVIAGTLGAAAMAVAAPAGMAIAAPASASGAASGIAAGKYHSCAILTDGSVRCWGYGGDGALGYGNPSNIGDDETPASAGPVPLGPGRTAKAIAAGSYHTCAILDDGSVRCWGFGGNGRLGYDSTAGVGAAQTPDSAGPVDLGPGHTAVAIAAGGTHTCAILDDGSVRCWGFGFDGQLGYGNTFSVGDGRPNRTGAPDQSVASAGPVDLAGHRATAIVAGDSHTCAILDDGSVRCWGLGIDGQLGYANTRNVGDTQTPGSVGPVDLGPGRTAVAIAAGGFHTCAILDDGTVRCWGYGAQGQLGYGDTSTVGDNETPASAGPVDLGPGRSARAISAGSEHTCAVLDDGSVRCWGLGLYGQLGYAATANVGDTPTRLPGAIGPVDLGPGRAAQAISAGALHTCALLDNAAVRCWGNGTYGRLGYCSESNLGGDEAPATSGPVSLAPGDGGTQCPVAAPAHHPPDAFARQALRTRALRACLAAAARRPERGRSGARTRRRARAACRTRYGRTPGRVRTLRARASSRRAIVLSFSATGTDGTNAPAARGYLIRQSRRPIRRGSDFQHAQALCGGECRFAVSAVGTRIRLAVTHLRPHRTYYFALAARDNVSGRLGPRSASAAARTH